MTEQEKRENVHRIFESISEGYDRANDRISAWQHGRWKQTLVGRVSQFTAGKGAVLDLCCGTGDVALALAHRNPEMCVTGLDFSNAMLAVAQKKCTGLGNVCWTLGDAMNLPFRDGLFDSTVVSFGLRNTENYRRVLAEMVRVTKPGGLVCCMETSWPDAILVRPFFRVYFKYIMPRLGGGKVKKREYQWLYESTEQFLTKAQLLELFQESGLLDTGYRSFLLGSFALHTGIKGW